MQILTMIFCPSYQTQPHFSVWPYPKTFFPIIERIVLLGFVLTGKGDARQAGEKNPLGIRE